MSDQSVITTSHHRGQRARRGEYAIYFSVILIVALPFAAAAWAVHLMRHRRLPERGPIARSRRRSSSPEGGAQQFAGPARGRRIVGRAIRPTVYPAAGRAASV
jgi:hypothetical protein